MTYRPRLPRLGFSVAVITALTLYGQACSKTHSQDLASSSTSKESTSSSSSVPEVPTGNLEAIQTYRVVHIRELLPNLISTLNFVPTQGLLNLNVAYSRNLSEDGEADSVSAPMWNSILTISGAACSDLVNQEKTKAPEERSIFKSVNFAKGPADQTVNSVKDTVRTLARSMWLRNETPEEMDLITSALEPFKDSKFSFDTGVQSLFICSAMASALDANVR